MKEKKTKDAHKEIKPEDIAASIIEEEAEKGNVLNTFEDVNYRVKSGSLILDYYTDGGLPPGLHRFVGTRESGKTSCSLNYLYHFLNGDIPEARGVYINSERRLEDNLRERSGVKFTKHAKEWAEGTCLIYETNVFESMVKLIKGLIRGNKDNKYRYFFIIDSIDALVPLSDLEKEEGESSQKASRASKLSEFLAEMGLRMTKFGHVAIFISQEREFIKISRFQKTPQRQGNTSGGNAIQHYITWAFNFKQRTQDDLFVETVEGEEQHVGHKCTIELLKTANEKTLQKVTYPIKYGRKNATSVWLEKELLDLLLMWEQITAAGKWLYTKPELLQEILEAKLSIPDKFDGQDNLFRYLESSPELVQFLYKKFVNIYA